MTYLDRATSKDAMKTASKTPRPSRPAVLEIPIVGTISLHTTSARRDPVTILTRSAACLPILGTSRAARNTPCNVSALASARRRAPTRTSLSITVARYCGLPAVRFSGGCVSARPLQALVRQTPPHCARSCVRTHMPYLLRASSSVSKAAGQLSSCALHASSVLKPEWVSRSRVPPSRGPSSTSMTVSSP